MKMTEEIKGSKFELKTYLPDDVTDEYVEWINTNKVNQYLEARNSKYILEDEQNYVNDILNSDDQLLMAIESYDTNSIIGNVHLTLNRMHKRCFIAYMIGDTRYWGQGIATEAIKMATKWAFENLDIARMDAGVYAANIGSIKAVLRAGYKVEGTRRSYVLLDDGSRCDVIEVGLLREEYEQLDYAK